MTATDDENLPFDRVVIVANGTREVLLPEQFLSLPLDRRIRHIMARELEFYRGDRNIDRTEALSSLRRRHASQRPPP